MFLSQAVNMLLVKILQVSNVPRTNTSNFCSDQTPCRLMILMVVIQADCMRIMIIHKISQILEPIMGVANCQPVELVNKHKLSLGIF